MDKLEGWIENECVAVLFDSDIDGKNSLILSSRIKNKSKLYFIVVDSNNNVFGRYHSNEIEKADQNYSGKPTFMFTLNSNGRCEVSRSFIHAACSLYMNIPSCKDKEEFDDEEEYKYYISHVRGDCYTCGYGRMATIPSSHELCHITFDGESYINTGMEAFSISSNKKFWKVVIL